MLFDVRGVDHGHDGIEKKLILQVLFDEEGLRHGTRIGESRGLDHDVVEAVAAFEKLPQDADEIAAHRAANAAIGGLEDFFLCADDEFLIHADFAELVLNHRDALAMLFGEDAVEERRRESRSAP
jgi:hypothetical protein